MIMALATILGFDFWSLDVKQAYLCSASKLLHNVFIKPQELDLGPGELVELFLPIYGLTDSGDY